MLDFETQTWAKRGFNGKESCFVFVNEISKSNMKIEAKNPSTKFT